MTRSPRARAPAEAFSISLFGKVLFEDQTLELTWGHRYGLIGQNGSGKTTFLKCIAGVSPDADGQGYATRVSGLLLAACLLPHTATAARHAQLPAAAPSWPPAVRSTHPLHARTNAATHARHSST